MGAIGRNQSMMKKKILTFMFMFALGITTFAQDNVTLILWHPDGTTTDVELYKQPLVQFHNDSVFITSPVLDLKYDVKDVLRFTYKGEGTGISRSQSEVGFSQENGQIVFHGVKSPNQISLYTINGMRIPIRLVAADGKVSLSLSTIPQGVYILSVNGKTSKFTKK